MLFCMEYVVIFISVAMILWGLAGFIGWVGVSLCCYGLITLSLIDNQPLLIGWLVVTGLLSILAFIVYSNYQSRFTRRTF